MQNSEAHDGPHGAENGGQGVKQSACLISAALAGILSVGAVACGTKKSSTPAPTQSSDSSAPTITSTTDSPNMNLSTFSDQCKTRGGLVETLASCSGASTCKGISFNAGSKQLVEHTCAGGNTCGGYSCVTLPSDGGGKGSDVYAAKCAGCHSYDMKTSANNPTLFNVYFPKAATDAATTTAGETAVKTFTTRSQPYHVSLVAFGTRGQNADGTEFSNMPQYYQKLSRAEIERVVEYIHSSSLTPKANPF